MSVDPRVELMSIVFRLAGSWEYDQRRVPVYVDAIDAHFQPYVAHPAVLYARSLREDSGISFNAPLSLALYADDVDLAERVPLDAPDLALDERWVTARAREFLDLLQDFRSASDYDAFFASHQDLYVTATTRLEQLTRDRLDPEWFSHFFGEDPGIPFIVIVGMAIGPMNFGVTVNGPAGFEERYAVIGASSADDDGLPSFGLDAVDLLVHEFNHSFVNPLVESSRDALEEPGSVLFEQVEAEMTEQAYGNWKTMLDETLVRAAVIRFRSRNASEGAVKTLIRDEEEQGFYWMEDIVQLLVRYESERETYPSLTAFFPDVVKLFEDLTRDPRGLVAERKRRLSSMRPQVLDVSIGNDEVVAAGRREIVVQFDRQMMPDRYAIMTQNKGDLAPEVLNVNFDSTLTLLTMEVDLEPSTAYSFSLNSDFGGAFRSAAGVKLARFPIRFRTAPGGR